MTAVLRMHELIGICAVAGTRGFIQRSSFDLGNVTLAGPCVVYLEDA